MRTSASQSANLEFPGHPTQPPLWMLYPLFFVGVFLAHLTLLRLPYFWDEGGYYIPAALDFFRTGSLIPHSTVTNAHPPIPSILLAGWWRVAGCGITATRTLICMISAAALLGVYRIGSVIADAPVAIVAAILTGIYPIWFTQSTLAHADIFAAAFTLWALALYFERYRSGVPGGDSPAPRRYLRSCFAVAILFSLAALSKETAIVTPAALALWELILMLRSSSRRRVHLAWTCALLAPAVPLVLWYAFHYQRTGFIFGNPEFLRYNATANLDAHRILTCLWHRFLHITMHMNMFVPVVCASAALLMPALPMRRQLNRPVVQAITVILIANWLAFSVLGGALLTRYLLPLYPLLILVCVVQWRRHMRPWLWLAAFSAAGFLAALWINPPYSIAPEDNLTYREMIVLHQRAAKMIEQRWPEATVLTAWPATAELAYPDLGYVRHAIKVTSIQNFAIGEMGKAAKEPGGFDTALIFSTKWEPPASRDVLGKRLEPDNTRYFDYHHDLSPGEAAALLHGQIVWQDSRRGEWAAVLRFSRTYAAQLDQPASP